MPQPEAVLQRCPTRVLQSRTDYRDNNIAAFYQTSGNLRTGVDDRASCILVIWQIDRGKCMTDHKAFSNWLREHEGYVTAAENLSEAELYSRIVRLPQHQHEGPTGTDGYEVELRDNSGTSSKFPAGSRKDS